jgi:putative lipoprotein
MPLTSPRKSALLARKASWLTGIVAILALSSCSTNPTPMADRNSSSQMLTVRGSLVYRERIALPTDSSAHISVQDVSIADRAADVITGATIELKGRQVPIDFEVPVDRAKLQSNHRYAVRATIQSSSGTLLWTTTEAHLVEAGTSPVQELGALTLKRVNG